MTEQLVLYDTDGKVGLVTLNRPDKLNALSTDVRRELSVALTKADEDAATSVVVLRGAGRSSCSGYDLGGGGNEASRNDALKFHQRLSASLALDLVPRAIRKPVTATHPGRARGSRCRL